MEWSGFDVLIIGGGLVGVSLAVALANQPIKIGIVEKNPKHGSCQGGASISLGLSLASVRIFHALGLWSLIKPDATPITQVHVSDAGHFGATRFMASDYQVNALGYVIAAHRLLKVLQECAMAQSNVQWLCPAELKKLEPSEQGYRVTIQRDHRERTLETKLLVAADGGDSLVRQLLHIPIKVKDYKQNALIATVESARHHQYIAYERFTKTGPLAALPLADNCSAIIWVVDQQQSDCLWQLDDNGFLQQLQQGFGYRLGRLLSVKRQNILPLRSLCAQQPVAKSLVLLGNSAHTLHPVAAQGFNLSMQDMKVLAQTIMSGLAQGQNIGDLSLLQEYQQKRRRKQKWVMSFTDGLESLFSLKTFPIPLARSLGLSTLNNAPLLKRLFMKQILKDVI